MTVKSLLYLLVFYQKPLDVTKEKYQEIKTAAENASESVNGYIKKSIENRMMSDKNIKK